MPCVKMDSDFELRNFKFQVGAINCCVCHGMYRRLPKYNEEMARMTKQEIDDSFGKYCEKCKFWYCGDCMHLNYITKGCTKCKLNVQ